MIELSETKRENEVWKGLRGLIMRLNFIGYFELDGNKIFLILKQKL